MHPSVETTNFVSAAPAVTNVSQAVQQLSYAKIAS